jgi:hemolysin III
VSRPVTATMHSASSSVIRPQLRGTVDIFAVVVAAPAALWLVVAARPGMSTVIAAIFGGCMCLLLVGSALYHRPSWPVRTFLWLRKIDLANIYLMVAGSGTPLAYAATPGPGTWILPAMWIAAGLGILKALLWSRGHRALNAGLYVIMGALIVPCLPAVYAQGGTMVCALYLLGALLYLVGAIIYALRWPNPAPSVFGYHEVFHMFVFAAAAAHFAAIVRIVT